MDQNSFKLFENVRLKATYDMNWGERSYQAGETIALFDKIQIAGLQDIVRRVTAHGGFDDRDRVFWESTREERLTFIQGVFNQTQFNLLANSKCFTKHEETILLSKREQVETDINGEFDIQFEPVGPIFFYTMDGNKLDNVTQISETHYQTPYRYLEIIVDYTFNYGGMGEQFLLGSNFFNGYLALEGTTKIKDDTTGQVVSGVLKIPRLKLVSDLSIRLGPQANPVAASFSAVGVPVGSRGSSYISEFYWLDSDLLDS